MSGASFVGLTVAAAAHIACFTCALQAGPSNEWFGVLFLVWLTIPSTISAIALAPRWPPVITAAVSGLITALIVDTLLLRYSYFWPLQARDTQIRLAMGYLLLFPAIAAACGAYVTIIIRAIQAAESRSAVAVGTCKGARFSATCALLSLPVLLLLLPSHADPYVISVRYLGGVIAGGTIVGALTGCSYEPLRRHSSRATPA